jgi:endoglucanase
MGRRLPNAASRVPAGDRSGRGRPRRRRLLLHFWTAALLVALPTVHGSSASPAAAGRFSAVRVERNRLVDAQGSPVVVHGVNRMGTEYACIDGWGIFEGPADEGGNRALLAAMARWHINAVRVPLNEQCWLGRETDDLDQRYVGENYRAAISTWVTQITEAGMVAIVDLHWTAPKGVKANGQQPMADVDNSPDFWKSAAAAFKNNRLVIFDLFNEPFLDREEPPPADPWTCWRDGCRVHLHQRRGGKDQVQTDQYYEAAGMQALVRAVRSTGASNPVMLGGLDYAARLDDILAHLPDDDLEQLIVAWHPYPGKDCGLDDTRCRKETVAKVMETKPVVAGEFGRNDCTDTGLDPFMDWMDDEQHRGSYLAWVWTVVPEHTCPGQGGQGKYDLISDYDGTPTTPYGAAVRAHYQKF